MSAVAEVRSRTAPSFTRNDSGDFVISRRGYVDWARHAISFLGWIASGMVRISAERIRIRARKYSFQAPTNCKIATVASAGLEMGRTTRQNAASSVQPSTLAASSSSRGMD